MQLRGVGRGGESPRGKCALQQHAESMEARGSATAGASNELIGIPPRREVEGVRVRDHRSQVGETRRVYDRHARAGVEPHVPRAAVALLPRVVKPHVRVAQVEQRSGHAIYGARPRRHGVHDRRHQCLVDVATEQIPRAPPPRRREREPIVERRSAQHHASCEQQSAPTRRHGPNRAHTRVVRVIRFAPR